MGNCVSNNEPQQRETDSTSHHDDKLEQENPSDMPEDEKLELEMAEWREAMSREMSGELSEESESYLKILRRFTAFQDSSKIDSLIFMIKEYQIGKKETTEIPLWNLYTTSGSEFLNIISHIFKMQSSFGEGILTMASKFYIKGETYWIMAGLSMIAFLLSTTDKMAKSQSECFELLRDMFHLVQHLQNISSTIQEEKFVNAIKLIVEGSIYCASQLQSENKSITSTRLISTIVSFNLEDLSRVRRELNQIFSEPFNPHQAVWVNKPVNDILSLLRPTVEFSLAVVIYGSGGIGKTTLAEAVLAKINLHHYNYTKVAFYEEEEKNDIKSLQQQILKDCFPTYKNGKPVELKDCKDGRDQLVKASQFEKDKPIFLFIDNASRSLDLKDLLPAYTLFLPPRSRILLTTRRLAATNMFGKLPMLEQEFYHLQPLAKGYALKILSADRGVRGNIEFGFLERILKICRGVPVLLKLVSAHLHKKTLAQLVNALESEDEIKEEKLSDRLVDFVYGELDKSTQEAFLDICCFFSNWKRQDVEYIVGAAAVTSLIRAGLISSMATEEILYFQEAEEELNLHDIIIAKGRNLAKDNRIMDFQSLCEAADEERLDQIKGIWLVNEKSNYVLQERHLRLMAKSLRVLALGDRMKFSKANEMEFEELRFLRVGSSIPLLPVKLEALNNLRVFHGPFSIGELIMYKLPTNLLATKIMEQSVDNKFKTPEVEEVEVVLRCPKLETIHFTGSRELRRLLEISNRLDALKTLILDDFTTIKELPHQICRLPALNVLSITKSACTEYSLEPFGELTALKQLRLSRTSALKTLPSTFSKFKALTHLDLEGCCSLEILPSYFENLIALSHLSLSGCKNLKTLPEAFGGLRALSHLNLRGCKSLETLPQTFGNLKYLKYLILASCEQLQALPTTFGNLSALKHLCLQQCTMLEALPDSFGGLICLEYLCLRLCKKLVILPESFGCLKFLKHLCLRQCSMLNTLPHTFKYLTSLEYLNICSCESLNVYPYVFGQLEDLKCLECSPHVEGEVKPHLRKEVFIIAY